jgi:hypothetical protein
VIGGRGREDHHVSAPRGAVRLPADLRGLSAGPGRRLAVAASGHQQTDALAGRGRRVERRDDATLVHDGDPVGEGENLVELRGDQEDRDAPVAHPDELVVDELDRADVDAARRLGRDDQAGVGVAELTGDDDLLLVAARQRLGGGADPRGPHVEAMAGGSRPVDEEDPPIVY